MFAVWCVILDRHIPGLAKSTTTVGMARGGPRAVAEETEEGRWEESEVIGRVHIDRQPGVADFFGRVL